MKIHSLLASSKRDGTALIRSGSTKIFIGNADKIWMFAKAKNHIQTSLDPGAVKKHAPVEIELKDGQNQIRASAELDGPNTVAELNENNNKCEIEFTAIVKAGK